MEIKVNCLTALLSHFVFLYFNAEMSFSEYYCSDRCLLFVGRLRYLVSTTVLFRQVFAICWEAQMFSEYYCSDRCLLFVGRLRYLVSTTVPTGVCYLLGGSDI